MNKTFDYVIVAMYPTDRPDNTAERLNRYGVHGYQLLPPVVQHDRVIYTLVREEAGE